MAHLIKLDHLLYVYGVKMTKLDDRNRKIKSALTDFYLLFYFGHLEAQNASLFNSLGQRYGSPVDLGWDVVLFRN